MEFLDEIITGLGKAKTLLGKPHSRSLSWEHCYKRFFDRFSDSSSSASRPSIDDLTIHLAFYLASWGMYRGSAFVLHYDYKIHEEAVKEILKEDYKLLRGCRWDTLSEKKKEHCLDLLFNEDGLVDKIRKHYIDFQKKLDPPVSEPDTGTESFGDKGQSTSTEGGGSEGKEATVTPSDTLVSKILLGTLGCVPAYDRMVKKALIHGKKDRGLSDFVGTFNRKSLQALIEYCRNYRELLNTQIDEISSCTHGIQYPLMKVMDMGLWEIGLTL